MIDLSKVKEVKEANSHEANALLATNKWILLFVGLQVGDAVCVKEDEFVGLKRTTYSTFILGRIQ